MNRRYRYKAFFSYNHEADKSLAPVVQQALQGLNKPWYKRRSIPIFRDETSLPMTPALWGKIEEALKASEHFILFACPQATQSAWVCREVAWWLEHHGTKNLHIILSSGTIEVHSDGSLDPNLTDALPADLVIALQEHADSPFYMDARKQKEVLKLAQDAEFRTQIRHLMAALIGISPEDIFSRERQIHRRNLYAAFLLSLVLLMITLFAIRSTRIAVQALEDAKRKTMIAESRHLAGESISYRERSPAFSILLGFESIQKTAPLGLVLNTSRQALRDALDMDTAGGVALGGHLYHAYTSAYSHQEKWLATGDRKGRVLIWELAQLHSDDFKGQMLDFPGKAVERIALCETNNLIAVALDDNTVRVQPLLDSLSSLSPITLNIKPNIGSLTFSPDGRFLTAINLSGQTHLFEFTDQKTFQEIPLDQLAGKKNTRYSVSRDGRWLAVGPSKGKAGDMKVWDLTHKFSLDKPAISRNQGTADDQFAFSPGGHWLRFNAKGESMLWNHQKNVGRITEAGVGGYRSAYAFSFDEAKHATSIAGKAHFYPSFVRALPYQRLIPVRMPFKDGVIKAIHKDGATVLSKGRQVAVAHRSNSSLVFKSQLEVPDNIQSIIFQFSKDGRWLFAGAYEMTLVYDMKTFALVHMLEGQFLPKPATLLSPKGRYVLTGGKLLRIWDVERLDVKQAPTSYARKLTKAFSWETIASAPDNPRVIGQLEGNTFSYVTIEKSPFASASISLPAVSEKPIKELLLSQDATWLATIHASNYLSILDIRDPQQPKTWFSSETDRFIDSTTGTGKQGEMTVCLSPDGRWLAAGNESWERLLIWELRHDHSSGDPIVLHAPGIKNLLLQFSKNSRFLLAVKGKEKTSYLWDFSQGIPVDSVTVSGHKKLNHARLSPNANWLATWGKKGYCQLSAISKGTQGPPISLTGHSEQINDVVFSQDGEWAVSISQDKTGRLWDLNTVDGSTNVLLNGHRTSVTTAAFSPDGRWLITTCHSDPDSLLWDLQSSPPGQLHDTLRGHGYAGVTHADFSPESQWLVLWGGTPNARVWDLTQPKPSKSMLLLRGDLRHGTEEDNSFACFTADSNWVFYVNNSKVFAKNLELPRWEQNARRYIGRNFTLKEWELFQPENDYYKVFEEFEVWPN